MFSNHFQVDEVIKEEFETVKNTMWLGYLVFFHLITPHKDLGMRKVWASLSRRWLEFCLCGDFLEEDKQKV